jgi:hypothetical protein
MSGTALADSQALVASLGPRERGDKGKNKTYTSQSDENFSHGFVYLTGDCIKVGKPGDATAGK